MKRIFLLCSLFYLFSCNKQDVEVLPRETQTGAGTFGFVLNGKTYSFNDEGSASLQLDKATLSIIAYNPKTGDPEAIEFYIRDFFTKKNISNTFQLDLSASAGIIRLKDHDSCYSTDQLHPGTLEITRFDTINGIISGRFSFDAVKYNAEEAGSMDGIVHHPNNADAVKIGSGRFDLKLGLVH